MQRAVGHAACEKPSIAAEVYREASGWPFVSSGFVARFLDAVHRDLAIQGNPEVSARAIERQCDSGACCGCEAVPLVPLRGPERDSLARRDGQDLAVGGPGQ